LNHIVAIKVLLPDKGNWSGIREQFLQEARAMISINHPNICRFFEFNFDNDVDYIVMEYIEGETLRSRLKRPLDTDEFSTIAEQCLQAMIEAHKKEVLHRDIKPENIMLSAEGSVKLCDFGLAKWLRGSEIEPKSNRDSGVKGTLGYIAPEVWQNRESDARADIYSLGVVFYEMLTGQTPFRHSQVVNARQTESPIPVTKWNPKVPRRLEKIIEKMLRPDPKQRYSSVQDVLVDMRRATPRWGRRLVRVAATLLA